MIFDEPLSFVREFVRELSDALERNKAGYGLSKIQREWLSFCLMGIMVTNSICWAKMERSGLGKWHLAALSWMFREAKIPWELLLVMSVRSILKKYNIREGVLVEDDSDQRRCKITKRIFQAHKIKDKKSGGYINGQTIVLLLLVTPVITIPVGFSFYRPDPALKEWEREDKELRKQKVAKKNRPPKPQRNAMYPMKKQIALRLLNQFKVNHPEVMVQAIEADSLYGSDDFMGTASKVFKGVQVISQIKGNQIAIFRNKGVSIKEYFRRYPGVAGQITIRGGEKVSVKVGSARLYVKSHKRKLLVIALRYEGEEEYRYLIASDLSWRTQDVVQAHTLRWLVEVFFEDWKLYEGWGQLTKQFDEEGSSRGLILSLLLDHCLLFHHQQLTRLENKLPACTVGSLLDRIKVESLLEFIRSLLLSEDPQHKLDLLAKTLEDLFQLRPSKKHMNNRDLGRLEPTPSLKYKARLACALAQ
jgi:hypothetical protein